MQKIFCLDPKQLNKQKRNIILLYGISGLIAAAFMFYSQRSSGTDRNPWLLIGVLVLMMVYFGVRSFRQRKELWDGYFLELSDDSLIQSQPKYPESRLALKNITDIEEGREGLWLSTRQGRRLFIIPIYLPEADYQFLKDLVYEYQKSNKAEPDAESELTAELSDSADDYEKPGLDVSAVPYEAEGVADNSEETVD